MRQLTALVLGTGFGIVLVKSQVASWFRIQRMFLFQEAHMYLVIASAIAVAMVTLWAIKGLGLRTVQGTEVTVRNKPFTRGTVIGGLLFGMGWAVTGACPGPMYAQIGSGEAMALVSFAGAFLGAYLYALVRPRLPH